MAEKNQFLGDYLSHTPGENGLMLKATNATAEITWYSDTVCRLCLARPDQQPEPFSYAVVSGPASVDHTLTETQDRLVLHTAGLTLEIKKYPIRFTFYTPAGELINADHPAFGTGWIGEEATTYKQLQEGERFLGLGAKTGNLNRAGCAYTHWNTDYCGYPPEADPLYTSFPFYMGLHHQLVYGIFFDNTYRTTFNFGASNHRFASFSAEAGCMNYYFIHEQNPAGILRAFTGLVGRMPLPPLWSLGYHQCRYSYCSARELQNVAEEFRRRDIPADVLYLDIHYMEKFKVFTWDRQRFPDPARLARELGKAGFQLVAILDPGIKIEPGYTPYEDGLAGDVFVKYPDGKIYAGQVWPGWCYFPDFTRPQTRQWWIKWMRELVAQGIKGFWADMNEPSTWGQCPPDLLEFDYEGRGATHKNVRNVYGLQMARSTWEGARQEMKNQRPFVLSRSGFTGLQRYAAVWTGDNTASDEHMLEGVQMVTSLGLSGMPFCGFDIGGFIGEASPDLFARWISIGAFTPFARGHTGFNTRRAEPWCFGEGVEEIARNYLQLRYRLLPYLYSTFCEASQTGMPVVRSLAFDYTHDPRIYEPFWQYQYLFGPALLVCPQKSTQYFVKIYLPEGNWYDFYTDHPLAGKAEFFVEAAREKLPLFVRGGSIIPMQQPVSCTGQAPAGPLELHVYPGKTRSPFRYYEDDGSTLNYTRGQYFQREMVLDGRELILRAAEGDWVSRFKTIKICLHGLGQTPSPVVRVNETLAEVIRETQRFCRPLAFLSPDATMEDPYGSLEVWTVTLPHDRQEKTITWAEDSS